MSTEILLPSENEQDIKAKIPNKQPRNQRKVGDIIDGKL